MAAVVAVQHDRHVRAFHEKLVAQLMNSCQPTARWSQLLPKRVKLLELRYQFRTCVVLCPRDLAILVAVDQLDRERHRARNGFFTQRSSLNSRDHIVGRVRTDYLWSVPLPIRARRDVQRNTIGVSALLLDMIHEHEECAVQI
jgi:hypothetical protein